MIKPLRRYVLVEKDSGEKKIGSIILTNEKKVGNLGTIIAIGEGEKLDSGEFVKVEGLKAGDKVIYKEYAGTEYEEDGIKYLLIKAEDILGVIE